MVFNFVNILFAWCGHRRTSVDSAVRIEIARLTEPASVRSITLHHRSVLFFYLGAVPPICFVFYQVATDKLISLPIQKWRQVLLNGVIDREFEFYEFFSFLKFNEFYECFSVEKNSQKIRNFANHRCLTCFDVLECNVHL